MTTNNINRRGSKSARCKGLARTGEFFFCSPQHGRRLAPFAAVLRQHLVDRELAGRESVEREEGRLAHARLRAHDVEQVALVPHAQVLDDAAEHDVLAPAALEHGLPRLPVLLLLLLLRAVAHVAR